jgi:hypothetical protein
VPIQVAGLALLFPQESGSLAMFTAIRRASSLRSLPLNNGSFLLDDTPCVASLTLRSCSRSILSSSCLFWVPWAAEIFASIDGAAQDLALVNLHGESPASCRSHRACQKSAVRSNWCR